MLGPSAARIRFRCCSRPQDDSIILEQTTHHAELSARLRTGEGYSSGFSKPSFRRRIVRLSLAGNAGDRAVLSAEASEGPAKRRVYYKRGREHSGAGVLDTQVPTKGFRAEGDK